MPHPCLAEDSSFPSKTSIVKYFQNLYGNLSSFHPTLNGDPLRNDVGGRASLDPSLQNELKKSISPAEAMEDIGFSCTANPDAVRRVLTPFASQLSSSSVAEIFGMMIRTQKFGLKYDHPPPPFLTSRPRSSPVSSLMTGQATDTNYIGKTSTTGIWNLTALVNALHDLVPDLNWTLVPPSLHLSPLSPPPPISCIPGPLVAPPNPLS